MNSVYQARGNLIQAELLIGPVLLVVVFMGALTIGRRVAAPIEQARRRQMDFTANASHELRTPLAVIQAQTSLALSQPRDGDWYQRAFTRVNQESQRMRRLVDDLLWLARFEAMPHSGRAEPVDIGVMAQQAVDRFAAVAEARDQRPLGGWSLAIRRRQHVGDLATAAGTPLGDTGGRIGDHATARPARRLAS